MEEDSNDSEPFLKIGHVWSERNCSNAFIKEENISDVEPETHVPEFLELETDDNSSQRSWAFHNTPEAGNDVINDEIRHKNKKTKKKNSAKTKNDIPAQCVPLCKELQILKKKLRCSDCRSMVCPECYKTVPSTIQNHFVNADGKSRKTFPCHTCDLYFLSKCSMQAHLRLHILDSPYVCPDCGMIYNNVYFLALHLINKCHHVYKVVKYQCPSCFNSYMSRQAFYNHLRRHVTTVYKCRYCTETFDEISAIRKHNKTVHTEYKKVRILDFFKCSMCVHEIMPNCVFQEHMKYHCDNTMTHHFALLCPCGQFFNSAQAFRTHVRNCKQKGILPSQWSFLHERLKVHGRYDKKPESQLPGLSRTCGCKICGKPVEYSKHEEEREKILPGVCDACFEKVGLDFQTGENLIEIEEDISENAEKDDKDCEIQIIPKEGQFLQILPENGQSTLYANQEFINATIVNLDSTNEEIDSHLIGTESMIQNSVFGTFYGDLTPIFNENNVPENIHYIQLPEEPITVLQNENNEEVMETADPRMTFTPSIQLFEEFPLNEGELYTIADGDKGENEEEIFQIAYDHIPSDHIGYLKAYEHCHLKDKVYSRDPNAMNFSLAKNREFNGETILDEETGLLKVREPLEPNEEVAELIKEVDVQPLEVAAVAPESILRTTLEARGGLSEPLFSCFFCALTFVVDSSAFQKLRLHLECFHPDAGINIESDQTCTLRSQQKFVPLEDQTETDCTSSDFNNMELRTLLEINQPEKIDEEQQQEERGAEEAVRPDKMPEYPEGKKILTERKQAEERGLVGDTRQKRTRSEEGMSYSSDSVIDVMPSAEEDEALKVTSEVVCVSSKTEDSVEELKQEIKTSSEEDNAKEKPQPSLNGEVSATDPKETTLQELNEEESPKLKLRSRKKTSEGGGSESSDTPKKEREVWSEFYKSLKFAETLKKKKKRRLRMEEGDVSSLANYSAKRVVKKPKRFMENARGDGDVYEFDSGNSRDCSDVELLPPKEEVTVTEEPPKQNDQKPEENAIASADVSANIGPPKKKRGRRPKYRRRVIEAVNGNDQKDEVKQGNSKNPELPLLTQNIENLTEGGEKPKKKKGRPRKEDRPLLGDKERLEKFVNEISFLEKKLEREKLKRKRKLSTRLIYYKHPYKSEKDDFSSGQVISNKAAEVDEKFICAICKESYQMISEFREHIVIHRMDDNTYQCMECGECFVVRPSLEKHLHAYHKIKDTDEYLVRNECCSSRKKSVDEVENEPLKENQCKVCKDQFNCQGDLNKHFRIHGMAFLKEVRKENRAY